MISLVEKINLQYEQAIRNIHNIIDKKKDTAQARYDRKKSMNKHGGKEPSRYTGAQEKMIHDLEIEKRLILKGVEATMDYLIETNDPKIDPSRVKQIIGDIEDALYDK